jgi:hypothetical protein
MMTWKGFVRKQSWPVWGPTLEFASNNQEELPKFLVKTSSVPAEIQTWHLVYASLEPYHSTTLLFFGLHQMQVKQYMR